MKSQDFELYADLKKFNTHIAPTWDKAFNEALKCVGKMEAEVKLLDYGCGDGKYFKYWLDRGLSPKGIFGLELSKKRVGRCHQIGWKNVLQLTPQAPLPYGDSSFDVINCMEVIEHIPAEEGKRVIRELRRIIRPGGVLLISTPNYPVKRFYDCCDAFLHQKWVRLRDDPTHVTLFNHKRLTQLLGQHFTQIEARPFKQGFLYKRFKHPTLLHKLFFLCHP